MSISYGVAGLGRTVTALAVLAAVFLWSPLIVSQSTTPTGTASLNGMVVTIENNVQTPLRRARVTLTSLDGGPVRVTDTDTDGRYRFDGFPPGQYRATAAKPGFVRVGTTLDANGQPPGLGGQINAGVNAGLLIPMERAAAIEGRLLSATGEPASGVIVRALRSTETPGVPPVTIQQTTTDDLGRYRLHTLPFGSYSIEATLSFAELVGRGAIAAPPPGAALPSTPRSFYPSGTRLEDAQQISVARAATLTGIDFTTPVPPPAPPAPPPPPGGAIQMPATPRPDTPAGTARIAGRVTRADTGRPINGATISLIRWEGGLGNPAGTRTDADGRFQFAQLAAGTYQLTANATGAGLLTRDFGWTLAAPTGRRIELANGVSFDQADVSLPRPGAVEGLVVDEFGDPVPGVLMQVATPAFIAGARRLTPANGRGTTDDLGRFRVFGLPPDYYYVMALSGAFAPPGDLAGFAPTYLPGTTTPGDATPVRVDIGRDASGIVLALQPARMSNVSGVIVDATGNPTQAGVMLMRTNQNDVRAVVVAQGRTGGDGRFSFRNVAEGTYAVQAFGAPQPGRAGGVVSAGAGLATSIARASFGFVQFDTSTAADALRVEVRSGATLKGRVQFNGDGPRPAYRDIRISAGPANFVSAPLAGGGPPENVWTDDGTFEVRNMSGLRVIFAEARPDTWTLQRMTLAGNDVTTAALDFRRGDIEGLEITLTNRAPVVTGSVMDGEKPAADYSVILFSVDAARWVFPTRAVALARPTQQGSFRVGGLPPGTYFAVALERAPAGTNWQDPQFLETLVSRATSVTLVEGQSRTLSLELVR